MARPADVKEKDIIAAGQALEQQGKIPNPGAIRAKLGFKGGILRIRKVWDAHVAGDAIDNTSASQDEMAFQQLPDELTDAISALIDKQRYHLEQITVHAYQRAQALFEQRLDDATRKFKDTMAYYEDYELNADTSIQRLEDEVKQLQREVNHNQKQTSSLEKENARLQGALDALNYAMRQPLSQNETKTTNNKSQAEKP
ncbi:DNA-binding protein [Glaciecola sp. 1036]|uniref:DNA-binding protein n=1 Tax=Alteromonadaceae TaxID=72275 RepID=UPI003CFF4EF1